MANEALAFPVYQPATRIITSITNSYPAVVTTGLLSFPGGVITVTPMTHLYSDGMILRLDIPYYYGMEEANWYSGEISIIDGFTFNIDIDTTDFDPFVIPPIITTVDPADPTLTVPLPPYRRLILSVIDPITGVKTFLPPTAANPIDIDGYAQCVPYAEYNIMLTAAVRNVLPYP